MIKNLKFAVLDHVSEKDLETALLRRKNLKMQLEDNRYYFHEGRSKKAEDACREKLYRDSFLHATRCINCKIGSNYDKERRKEIFQSFRKIVSMDLSYSNIALFVYESDMPLPGAYFPPFYYDENGIAVNLGYKEKVICIDGKYVVEVPYDEKKWLDHLEKEEELIAEKYDGPLPYYYPELEMIVQGSGCIHRTAEVFVSKRFGTAMVNEYDTSGLYNNVTTDGANWISVHDGEIIEKVGDYRFALVFWLKKRELLLESESVNLL